MLLLHELHHRVINEFAAVIGFVSLAAVQSSSDEVKAALSGVTELLKQYADVHRALQMPPDGDSLIDVAAYLARLCLSISRSKLDHRKINLIFSAQSLLLHAERCWRLGMVVYELVTNSARHAYENHSGEIRVALWRDGEFVKCSVQDGGSSAASFKAGRGLRIVDGLSKTFGGRFKQTFGRRGSKSLLVFPQESEHTFDRGPSSTVCLSRDSYSLVM